MPPKPLGNDYINNCLTSAGYSWCEILNKCVRVWEEMCEYPSNCLTWNDGCNVCQLIEGELGACSEMYCFTQGMPFCQVETPMMVIDPIPFGDSMKNPERVFDPMPPVINPFLGDGH